MSAFSTSTKRHCPDEIQSMREQLRELRAELKLARGALDSSSRDKGFFHPQCFTSKRRAPSPEGVQRMRDLVRGPTLRRFDSEIAKIETPLYSRAQIVDLIDGQTRLAKHKTLNKPLFYEWAAPVVEEVVNLFPRLESRVPEIYSAILFVVRTRRKNHNASRKKDPRGTAKKLRFQAPSKRDVPATPEELSPERKRRRLRKKLVKKERVVVKQEPGLVLVKSEPVVAKNLGRAKRKVISPPVCIDLRDSSDEESSEEEFDIFDTPPKVEKSKGGIKDAGVFAHCVNDKCKCPLTRCTAFPQVKKGREWAQSNIRFRCETCWIEHKKQLISDISMKPKKKTSAKKVKNKTVCTKCGSTDHKVNDCYLKKGALVSVLYEGKWWDSKILLVHRGKGKGGYTVKYEDDEGCTQPHVPSVNIRPRS